MKQIVNTPYGRATIYRQGSGEKVLIVPGFSESIAHNKELVDRLARKGYDAFTFSQPRRDANTNPLNRQRDIILSVLDSAMPHSQQVDAVAHSFGAATLLSAAQANPKRFKSLLLMQPSGVGNRQSFFRLVWHIGVKSTKNHTDAIKRRTAKDPYSITLRQVASAFATSMGIIGQNPLLAFRETKVAIQHVIFDDILAIQELGIPVHSIMAYSDELFTIKIYLDSSQITELAGSYNNLFDKQARHDTFWIHPEQTTQLIDLFINKT